MTVPVFLSIQVTSFRLTNKNHTRFKQNSCTFNHFLHSHAVLFYFIQSFFVTPPPPSISIHSGLILDADDKYIFSHLFISLGFSSPSRYEWRTIELLLRLFEMKFELLAPRTFTKVTQVVKRSSINESLGMRRF